MAGRDNHLRDTDFFDVKQFPEITFRSERIERDGKGWALVGPLTMHGVTKSVRIPFRRTHKEPVVALFGTPSIIFEGSLKLKRKDFGINANARWNTVVEATGQVAMSDEVEIRLRVIGQRKSPSSALRAPSPPQAGAKDLNRRASFGPRERGEGAEGG